MLTPAARRSRNMALAVWLVLSFTLWAARTSGQTGKAAGYAEAERAVTKLEQEWFAIQQANDWAKLAKIIADDFVLVESDGSLGSRDSMLQGYREEASRIVSLKMQVLVAHAVAPNAVIASGLDDIALKDGNGTVTHRYERFIDTWILRAGRWQCVAEQITLAKPK
jgi:ketosteroid isomerase-like protein